jgi:hypothetical protein
MVTNIITAAAAAQTKLGVGNVEKTAGLREKVVSLRCHEIYNHAVG